MLRSKKCCAFTVLLTAIHAEYFMLSINDHFLLGSMLSSRVLVRLFTMAVIIFVKFCSCSLLIIMEKYMILNGEKIAPFIFGLCVLYLQS
jgi:hypothetical protein